MFNIDGEVLNITLDMGLDDVVELKNFIESRLEYIDEIGIDGSGKDFATSSLLQLLISIKKSKPEIKIPLLEGCNFELKEFGKISWTEEELVDNG